MPGQFVTQVSPLLLAQTRHSTFAKSESSTPTDDMISNLKSLQPQVLLDFLREGSSLIKDVIQNLQHVQQMFQVRRFL